MNLAGTAISVLALFLVAFPAAGAQISQVSWTVTGGTFDGPSGIPYPITMAGSTAICRVEV